MAPTPTESGEEVPTEVSVIQLLEEALAQLDKGGYHLAALHTQAALDCYIEAQLLLASK